MYQRAFRAVSYVGHMQHYREYKILTVFYIMWQFNSLRCKIYISILMIYYYMECHTDKNYFYIQRVFLV